MYLCGKDNIFRLCPGDPEHRPGKTPFYYDFSTECTITDWQLVSRCGDRCLARAETVMPAGDFILLIPEKPIQGYRRILPETIFIDGVKYIPVRDGDAVYARPYILRYGITHTFGGGRSVVEFEFTSDEKEPLQYIDIAVIAGQEPVGETLPLSKKYDFPIEEIRLPVNKIPDISTFTAGVDSNGNAGRFGFVKGDGLLDCGIPYLGVIDKMFVSGFPRYKKPFRWGFVTHPENMPLHGTFLPGTVHPSQDKLQVNALAVRWEADLGDGKFFRNIYSVASAGVIHESNLGEMRLAQLQYAGNYRYMLIPQKNGCKVVDIRDMSNLEMSENFLLLFGSDEYPDIPIMLSFDCEPSEISVKHDPRTHRLQSLIFAGVSRMITVTPFGYELPESISPDDEKTLADAVKRCRFWSRALLAYPVSCREYFKIDNAAGKVTVVEKFTYEHLSDAWGTKPLEIAPLPPVIYHCKTAGFESAECFFPTKYGEFHAVLGSEAVYTLPLMELERKFPLKNKGESGISDAFADGFDEYFDFVSSFSDDIQSGPFFGSLFDPYAFASTLFNFLPREKQDKVVKKIKDKMAIAADRESSYRYPVVDFLRIMREKPGDKALKEMYSDPEMKYLKLWNYYPRVEPFTGIEYDLCYINLCLFNVEKEIRTGTREEIAGLDYPMIENDWGIGCSFCYMYLCILAAGDSSVLKKNWQTFKRMYKFFAVFHDWACMSSGYNEDGNGYVEGANFAGFTVFPLLAEMMGDKEAAEFSIYLAAKQLALRASVVCAADYFRQFYGGDKWYFWKYYRSEGNPAQDFQYMPKLLDGKCNDDGVYNFTTEGMYPEYFLNMQKHLGREFNEGLEVTREVFENHINDDSFGVSQGERRWTLTQGYSSILLNEVLDENYPAEKFLRNLEFAKNNNFIYRKFRGMHNLSRRLPQNFFECFLLALLEMRKHPVWLLHWENCRIISAEWDEENAAAELDVEVTASPAKIRLGVRKFPAGAVCGNSVIQLSQPAPGRVELQIADSGKVKIRF